ncbi:MAG: hypothetical protein L6262_08085 [Weeksellaceae bacterium]|nr:hypothetical protein [Weeksellaceae bacterium]
MIKKWILLFILLGSITTSAQRRKNSWTEKVTFSADPHVKVMTSPGNNFLGDAFDYFYGFGIGLNANLYRNFGLGVEYTYFLANIKKPELSGYLGAPSMNNFDWYLFHKDKITEEFFVEEVLGYSTYRMKSPFLDGSGKFSEGNGGLNFGAKAVLVLDAEGIQAFVFGAKLNFYHSKIGNQNPDIENYYSKATLLSFSLAYRFTF